MKLKRLTPNGSVDLGYKGKDHHPEDVQVHLSNKSRKKMTRWG
ncbi:hypothetical protein LEP1GSC073_3712 [Leptospira noguchii str. Cascata]|nr:hypothetical protein LEP1GSC073_3712 [Leptospira noguchii str. Cascata]